MDGSVEVIVAVTASLLLISVMSSMLSRNLGVPALLLFLVIGMLAGSFAGSEFGNPKLCQFLGVIALVLILFEAGLNTKWKDIRPIIWQGLGLSTLGVLITALLVCMFAVFSLKFSWLEGFLLGSIIASTDAAAVYAILGSKNVALKGPIEPLLGLESASNDPTAVFLTSGVIYLMTHAQASLVQLIPMFIQQMIIGTLAGLLFGRLMIIGMNRCRLEYDGLYPVFSLSLVMLTYGLTALLGGNGFLAVYLAALVMGNSDCLQKRILVRFHEGLAWLMQIVMFLTLGLLVAPADLLTIAPAGLLMAVFLILVARPISVFLTLHTSSLTWADKAMISWVGLRGAVPIILATFPLLAGIPKATYIFDLVFFIVLSSVLLQGTSIPKVAKWLAVEDSTVKKLKSPLEFNPTAKSKNDLIEVPIPTDSPAVGKQLVELGLPRNVLVTLISRQGEFVVPGGATTLQSGDILLILADKSEMDEVHAIVKAY